MQASRVDCYQGFTIRAIARADETPRYYAVSIWEAGPTRETYAGFLMLGPYDSPPEARRAVWAWWHLDQQRASERHLAET